MNKLSDSQIREMDRLEKHGEQWVDTPKKAEPSRQIMRRAALKLKKKQNRILRQRAVADRRRNGGL